MRRISAHCSLDWRRSTYETLLFFLQWPWISLIFVTKFHWWAAGRGHGAERSPPVGDTQMCRFPPGHPGSTPLSSPSGCWPNTDTVRLVLVGTTVTAQRPCSHGASGLAECSRWDDQSRHDHRVFLRLIQFIFNVPDFIVKLMNISPDFKCCLQTRREPVCVWPDCKTVLYIFNSFSSNPVVHFDYLFFFLLLMLSFKRCPWEERYINLHYTSLNKIFQLPKQLSIRGRWDVCECVLGMTILFLYVSVAWGNSWRTLIVSK